MKTHNETVNQTKRVYSKPECKTIRIDNQISMVMMSEPPVEGVYIQHTNNTDPYKISKT